MLRGAEFSGGAFVLEWHMPAHDLLERIATNLRSARDRRGLTREQLGATAEVDPQLIKRIESGRANPALVVLSRLAAALTITTSLVLSGGELLGEGQEQPYTVEAIDADTVGETLTALRRNRQMSRRALAQRADLRASTVARYESASTDARILALEPIAAALGMQTEEFVRAVELRQQQRGTDSDEWQSPADGVVFRLIASGANSRLWEWRLAPGAEYADESPWEVEEIATAIRGRVNVASGEELHQLHRGGSVVLPRGATRRFVNAGTSTARLLRYRSVSDARSTS